MGQLGWQHPSLQQEPGASAAARGPPVPAPSPFPAGILQTPFASASAVALGEGRRTPDLHSPQRLFVSPHRATRSTMCSEELRACLTASIRFSVTLSKGYFFAVRTPPSLFSQCRKMDLRCVSSCYTHCPHSSHTRQPLAVPAASPPLPKRVLPSVRAGSG